MAKYSGRRGVVYMSTSGTGTAVNVANLTSWSLNMATDRFDVTSFTDTNKTYVQGLRDISGQFQGFFDDTATAALFTAAESADAVKIYLYPSADAAARYFYGTAFLDMSISTPVNGAVTVNGSFAAASSWVMKLS